MTGKENATSGQLVAQTENGRDEPISASHNPQREV